MLIQVTENDEIIGAVPRKLCHGNPTLIHRAIHILVLNQQGQMLLQKRSQNKDTEPGKWDSSVGGHIGFGQSYEEAAIREAQEEIGVTLESLHFLYDLRIRDAFESENIKSYLAFSEGPFVPCPHELETLRFWSKAEILSCLYDGTFTPSFAMDFKRFLQTPWAIKLQ